MGPRRSGRTTLLERLRADNHFDLVIDNVDYCTRFHPEVIPAVVPRRFLVSVCGGPDQVPEAFRDATFLRIVAPADNVTVQVLGPNARRPRING